MATEVCDCCVKVDKVRGTFIEVQLQGEQRNHDWENFWLPNIKTKKEFRELVRLISKLVR